MEIITASAGSGKTYTLAQKYIDILLSEYLKNNSVEEFEHILAVTFTNKATAEMKDRILKELNILATNPTSSNYYEKFKELHPKANIDNKTMWQDILLALLNNYSHFSVSTIDTFFQSVLKSFARELDNYNNYRVEIDREAVIEEVADNILQSITSSDPIYKYLELLSKDTIAEGKSVKDKELVSNAAKNLLKGSFKTVLRKCSLEENFFADVRSGVDTYLAKLTVLEGNLKSQRQASLDAAKAHAQNVLDGLNMYENDIKKNSAVRRYIQDFINTGKLYEKFSWESLEVGKFFNKGTAGAASFVGTYCNEIQAFKESFDAVEMYKPLIASLPNLYLAARVFTEFETVMDENNVKCLDETTEILSRIIAGSDAPFIYEKIGVRYKHFLLDEFQDTSDIQWDNFRPLLENAESEFGRNLIVGDIKQSIYRFRNSDAEILAGKVPAAFPQAKGSSLEKNFRSASEIVKFNNQVFVKLAEAIDNKLIADGCLEPGVALATSMYPSVGNPAKLELGLGQAVGKTEYAGYIDIKYFDDYEDLEDNMVADVVEKVQRLLSNPGIKPNDILVLVRGKEEAGQIASALLAKNIGISCEESLRIESNVHARQLLSVLRHIDNPNDEVSGHLVKDLKLDSHCKYPNLVTLCEQVAKAIIADTQESFAGSIAYISAFIDLVRDYENNYGNSLHTFLDFYDRTARLIASTPSEDAVQIMTIHKAKGLAGNFVIVPFIQKINTYLDNPYYPNWAQIDAKKFQGSGYHEYIYNVKLKEKNLAFHDAYHEEKRRSYIDAINLLYVAFTRAKFGLYIIGHEKGSKETNNMGAMLKSVLNDLHYLNITPPENASQFKIKSPLGDEAAAVASCITDKKDELAKRAELKDNEEVIRFEDYLVNVDSMGVILNSNEANDFFLGTVAGEASEHDSSRIKGIVKHDILSLICTEDDVERAVKAKYDEGVLETSLEETIAYFRAKLASVQSRGWFAPEAKIISERDILVRVDSIDAESGKPVSSIISRRPDRVVVHPDGSVDIVDYKFTSTTESKTYEAQVASYCQYYRALGYGTVHGYLWYVNQDVVEPVE